MKYKVDLQYRGLGNAIIASAEDDDGLHKMQWTLEYNIRHHQLWVRGYRYFERATKRHDFKQIHCVGVFDKRDWTLTTLTPPPPELCDMAIKKWGAVTVDWEHWQEPNR